ncbi:hypothetical protein JCM19294_1668 [Nonlabens tegetincola]|uniref:FAS1 domain-containing protein n=1 Tax=Nonlabens tegetincola TaxID=323273 RepID=A0A090QRF6_9FLAO|nr:hypothetical protein [Nonlabens tegetincola]GAK98046.1 hypothetical protein JCM19294_1668 [Nonlabens tegetincola]
MRTIFKIKFLVLLISALVISSCELDLQDNYEFESTAVFEDPYEELTAYEFIQLFTTPVTDDDNYDPEHFNYMEAAIRKAGMVDVFNQTADDQRTYLLLNNNAFVGNGDVISIITGSAATRETVLNGNGDPVLDPDGNEVTVLLTPDEVMERVDTPEKLEKLKTLLNYHITADYVDQVPTLAITQTWYTFQTLIPGQDGVIAYKRDDDWDIQINGNGSPMPATARTGGWTENVRNHNYVFSNGLGHIIADPVRNQPY